jgi:stage V sporulation protein D (sporulation-specific penicillin-binding protein)
MAGIPFYFRVTEEKALTSNHIANKKRMKLLFYLVIILLVVIVVKLLDLMVVQADTLQAKAERQWTKDVAAEPKRGAVRDRTGEILAASTKVESVVLYPEKIKDPGEVADALAPILGMDRQKIFETASDKKKVEVWLKRQISEEEAEEIRALKLTGVGFFTDIKRVYPYNSNMAQLLGYTSADGEGQTGIEKKYEAYLSGKQGTVLSQVDAQGRKIEETETTYIKTTDGMDVHLTLDVAIQSFTENAVATALEKTGAQSVSAVVLDPTNGEILAMANAPQLDLNNLDRSDIAALNTGMKNNAIGYVYEPGSIFNFVTMAAGLDSGTAALGQETTCEGHIDAYGTRFHCWREGAHGTQTRAEAFAKMCIPSSVQTALDVNVDRMHGYITKFGFGAKTGVDLPGETGGTLKALRYTQDIDLAEWGMGQGLTVTPLQLAAAAGATVNGGIYYTPRLAAFATDTMGNIEKQFGIEEKEQVISTETSNAMRNLFLESVTNGNASGLQIAGYQVGGLAGTAQKVTNGIVTEDVIMTVVAFAPVEDPQYLIVFTIDAPQVEVQLSEAVATPYVRDVLEKCLKYGGETAAIVETTELPNFVGLTVEAARDRAREAGLNILVSGTGTIAMQAPQAGTMVAVGSTVSAFAGTVAYDVMQVSIVPDVRGMRLDEAYEVLSALGLDMQIIGGLQKGYVAEQFPQAGEKIAHGEIIQVTCKAEGNEGGGAE